MISNSDYSCTFINKWMDYDLDDDYCQDDIQFLQDFIDSDNNLFNYNIL